MPSRTKKEEAEYEKQMLEFLDSRPSPKEIRIWFAHAALCDLQSMQYRNKTYLAETLVEQFETAYVALRQREDYDLDLCKQSLLREPPKGWSLHRSDNPSFDV